MLLSLVKDMDTHTGLQSLQMFLLPELHFSRQVVKRRRKKANQMYNDDQVSCFKRLEVIGFKLGSSSKGDVPRRKRRILVPNSYFRDFEVNKCTARIHFSVNEKLAYECLMFYSVSPEHSK